MGANHMEIGIASVGAFIAIGKLLEKVLEELGHQAGWLSSISYIAAIIVAIVTLYYKIKNKGK